MNQIPFVDLFSLDPSISYPSRLYCSKSALKEIFFSWTKFPVSESDDLSVADHWLDNIFNVEKIGPSYWNIFRISYKDEKGKVFSMVVEAI